MTSSVQKADSVSSVIVVAILLIGTLALSLSVHDILARAQVQAWGPGLLAFTMEEIWPGGLAVFGTLSLLLWNRPGVAVGIIRSICVLMTSLSLMVGALVLLSMLNDAYRLIVG